MRLPRPRSILGLLLAGFTAVAAPLVWLVYQGMVHIEELSNHNERLVSLAMEVTQEGQSLEEQVNQLQRNARQYHVLRDPQLFDLYQDKHARFLNTVNDIARYDYSPEGTGRVHQMRVLAHSIEGNLRNKRTPNWQEFRTLARHASEIRRSNTSRIDQEVASLRVTANRARETQLWHAAAVVPITAILAAVFTFIIARPIRQLIHAIHRLGKGGFATPVQIGGPPELKALGTELDWLRRQLLALEQEKNLFLRQMSHELKTPLASIREGTELLGDGSVGNLSHTQDEVVEILRDSGIELEKLIENLLSFSAWQQSKANLNLSHFVLPPLVDKVLDLHRLEILRKELNLIAEVEVGGVCADREKLRMTIDNLVSNAVKYTPSRGILRVRATIANGQLLISVDDSGPGIEPDERGRVFEPFYQGSSPRGRHVRGTGIGLSVVKECVQAHGGNVHLTEAPEGGASFRLSLPVIENVKAIETNADVAPSHQHGRLRAASSA